MQRTTVNMARNMQPHGMCAQKVRSSWMVLCDTPQHYRVRAGNVPRGNGHRPDGLVHVRISATWLRTVWSEIPISDNRRYHCNPALPSVRRTQPSCALHTTHSISQLAGCMSCPTPDAAGGEPSRVQIRQGEPCSNADVAGEPSPSADVGGVSPVPLWIWRGPAPSYGLR
jgi:hypothetical protein